MYRQISFTDSDMLSTSITWCKLYCYIEAGQQNQQIHTADANSRCKHNTSRIEPY